MPPIVRCPKCSVQIRIREEFVGRAIKCPRCQEVIAATSEDSPPAGSPRTIPVTPAKTELKWPEVTTPTAASNSATSAPQGRKGDTDEARPRPKRRPESDDEVGPAKRRRPESNDEAGPPKRRRSDDETTADRPRPDRRGAAKPKKKGGLLVIVVGILGGLFLGCLGCGGGVFYFVIRPMGEKVDEVARKTDVNTRQTSQPNAAATSTVENTSTAPPTGDTPAAAKSNSPPAVATLAPDDLSRNYAKYKDQWVVVKGRVRHGMELSMQWQNVEMVHDGIVPPLKFRDPPGNPMLDRILISTGDEVEIKAKVGGLTASKEYVELFECELQKRVAKADLPPEPAPKPPTDTPNTDGVIEITVEALVDELIADRQGPGMKYAGKTLRVTGEVRRVTDAGLSFAGKAVGTTTYQVSVMFPPDKRAGLSALKPGDKATVEGKFGLVMTPKATVTLRLSDGKLVN
jgi:hypothetical protein